MPTVTSLKSMYIGQIAPGNDVEFLRLVTEADLRLLESGKWRWCRSRVTLSSVAGVITLPATLASVLGAHLDGHPAMVSDEDLEFSPEGPGEIDVDGGSNVRLIDQGLDENGLRTYKVTGCDGDQLDIIALCMKAPAILYDPDIDESGLPDDATVETRCPDHGAIKLAALAIIYEEQGAVDASAAYMGKAIGRLDAREINNRKGGAKQIPNIRPNGAGVKSIRSFR